MCLFEPTFDVPYRLMHWAEALVQAAQEQLDWAWRCADILFEDDP